MPSLSPNLVPRSPRRLWFVSLCMLAVCSVPVGSSTATATDPFDLTQGLRENGLADLSLEYLKELEAKKPPATVAVQISLERAKSYLELASDTTEPSLRSKYIREARAGFDEFLKKNANHPRRPEAALALARLVSVQAKAELSAATRIEDPAESKRLKVASRDTFNEAIKRYETAVNEFRKLVDVKDQQPQLQKQRLNEFYQSKLDQAITQFTLIDTYSSTGASADEILARGKVINTAKALFEALAKSDQTHPTAWVAKAWMGECEREKTNMNEAQKLFDEVKRAANRSNAAMLGLRQVRFFEARAEYFNAFSDSNRVAAFRKAQGLLDAWLADAKKYRTTPENFAAQYYLAKSKELQANYKQDEKTKQVTFTGNARSLLNEAEKAYRKLADPENDYTERAAEDRTRIIRILIGDPAKLDPATQTDFDFCLMAAQVQLYNTLKEIPPDQTDERRASAEKVVAFFERLQSLPVTKELEREAQNAKPKLVFAYVLAERPYEAATLGEHLARTLRSPNVAALSGLYAINAYRQASARLDPTDAASQQADLEKAIQLGFFLDRTFPEDPRTDTARIQITQLLLQNRRYKEGFELASRVSATSNFAMNAKFFQSLAAFELLRPTPPGADPATTLAPEEREAIRKQIIASLSNLPSVPDDTSAEQAKLAVLTELQLAEMYFLSGTSALVNAEQAAAKAAERLASFTALDGDDKQELAFRIELAKMRAAYGQALLAFQGKNFDEVFAKIGPPLEQASKQGAVYKPELGEAAADLAKRVDEFRRERILGLAIQTRIRQGAIDQIPELLDTLKKLGGSLANSAGTLGQLIDGAKPQIEALIREGKPEEATKLAEGIGQVLDRVASEPGVTAATILVLGKGLTSIGNYDKAIEFLKKIPAPANADAVKLRPSEIEEADQPIVGRFKLAQLELAKAYRLAKQFDEAEAILKEALPTKDANGRDKPNTGWYGIADFKRESAYWSEAKAEATENPAEAAKLWGEARQKWTEQANQYLVPLRKLLAGKKDEKSAFLALFELRQLPPHPSLPKNDPEIRAGLAERNPPAWVNELLAPDSPYVIEMRNTIARIESQLKPMYHEFVFESLRCLTRANLQVQKSNPMRLAQSLAGLAKSIFELEKANPDLGDTVKTKFAELLTDVPALKEEYVKLGGRAFLTQP